MANAQKTPVVKHGSAGHKQIIEAGYGMSFARADTIIKERKADPRSWPYEQFEKAEAMIAAAGVTKPKPTSDRPGWKRDRR